MREVHVTPDKSNPETRDTCELCDRPITPALVGDALCLDCRYKWSGKRVDRVSEFDIGSEDEAFDQFELAASEDLPPEARLMAKLQGYGLDPELSAEVLNDIQPELDEMASQRGGEAMRCIAMQLGDTAAGIALRRVLSGDATPLREVAAKAGVSHVAIWKQERKIRNKLRGLTSGPLIER